MACQTERSNEYFPSFYENTLGYEVIPTLCITMPNKWSNSVASSHVRSLMGETFPFGVLLQFKLQSKMAVELKTTTTMIYCINLGMIRLSHWGIFWINLMRHFFEKGKTICVWFFFQMCFFECLNFQTMSSRQRLEQVHKSFKNKRILTYFCLHAPWQGLRAPYVYPHIPLHKVCPRFIFHFFN